MKTLAALREKGHIVHERLIQKILDLPGIVVSAKEQPDSCEICHGPMRVQKTFRHEGRTIAHGTFQVQETI